MQRKKRTEQAPQEERAQPLIKWGMRDQFFVVDGEREALGFIKIDDRRLDKVLFEALSNHPAFTWDEKENGYIVDVDGDPQPIATKYKTEAFRHSKPKHVANDEDDEKEADEKPRPSVNDELNLQARMHDQGKRLSRQQAVSGENPRWRGTGVNGHYTSKKLGWKLDLIKDRGEDRLPRGERGKHWRLTHPDSDNEVWYKSKGLATEAIVDGTASKAFF